MSYKDIKSTQFSMKWYLTCKKTLLVDLKFDFLYLFTILNVTIIEYKNVVTCGRFLVASKSTYLK